MAVSFYIKVLLLKWNTSCNGSFERELVVTSAFKPYIFLFALAASAVLGQKSLKEHNHMVLIGAPYLHALASIWLSLVPSRLAITKNIQ